MSKHDFTLIRISVTAEQKRQLEALAIANQVPMAAVARKAIREFLAVYNQGPTPPELQPELAGV